jgi:hypothetical protein
MMADTKRRLSDKILNAFNHACDDGDREVAEGLYKVLEVVLTRHGGAAASDKRQNVEFIREAGARLQAVRLAIV